MSEVSSEAVAPDLEELLAMLPMDDINPALTIPHNVGMTCETKTLYEGPSRCDCCINWVETHPHLTREAAEETWEVKRHAILCRVQKAHGCTTKSLELHSIVIQSPILKRVLGEVFAGYSGITTTLEKLEFRAPFWEFFYRWQAFTDAQNTDDDERLQHIRLLSKELTSQLGDVHHRAKDLVQNKVMTYDFLWTLFPPKTLVYFRNSNQDYLLEVFKTGYTNTLPKTYNLACRYVEWDGTKFGWKKGVVKIPEFPGTKPIQDLEAHPLTYHKAPQDTQLRFLNRGRKFVSLCNCQQKAYRGIISTPIVSSLSRESCLTEALKSFKISQINERVMVDATGFFSHEGSSANLDPLTGEGLDSELDSALSDYLVMLCSPVVKAYALTSKKWGDVDVDGISDINWDRNAWDNLVLENETKQLIKAFVYAYIRQKDSSFFDDIVEGKGQGMIMLLEGETGTGKTLTAETVAEATRRPLYMLSAGELGTSSDGLETKLTEVLRLAYRWTAVLLLNESDVFFEQRTSDNLERNQLVSIFLRQLEYYRGILFLTSNRLSTFDTAAQSRMDLILHYPPLNQVSRRKIWQTLLERTHEYPGIPEEELDILAKESLNGRQIKKAVKGAKLLAMADDVALNIGHIKLLLQVMRKG